MIDSKNQNYTEYTRRDHKYEYYFHSNKDWHDLEKSY